VGDMSDETQKPMLSHRVDIQLHTVAETAMTDGMEDGLTNGVFVGCTRAICLAVAELRDATLTASGLFEDGSETDNDDNRYE